MNSENPVGLKSVLQCRKLRLILCGLQASPNNLRGTYGEQTPKYDGLSAFF